jgi:hypothetical protein
LTPAKGIKPEYFIESGAPDKRKKPAASAACTTRSLATGHRPPYNSSMPVYRVEIEGADIQMGWGDAEQSMGFYVIRFTDAADAHWAEFDTLEQIREEIAEITRNRENVGNVTVKSVSTVEDDLIPDPQPEMIWFAMEDDDE